jgi:hypothetical protein
MPALMKITFIVGKIIGLFWGLEKGEMIPRSTLGSLSGVSQDSSGCWSLAPRRRGDAIRTIGKHWNMLLS